MTPAEPSRPRWDIGEVLARVDLGELLDEVTYASGAGRQRRWHCPAADHDDTHASVTTFVDRTGHQRWKCWSGDPSHRGDAIDLITLTIGKPRADAIDWLAGRAHMIPDHPLPPPRPRPTPAPAPAVLDPVVGRYVDACARILWSRTGGPVRNWLHQRGLDDATLRAHRVGVDPGRVMLPRTKGLPRGTALAATFPALNPSGRCVTYVQARYLDPGTVGVKYDNPSAALGPNPRLAWCQPDGDARPGRLIVVEGIPDALVAAQAGIRSVGLLGSSTPDPRVAANITAVARAEQRTVTIIPDRDDAGRYASRALGELLAELDVVADVLEPHTGVDLTDWAKADPAWSRHLDPTPAVPAPQPALTRTGRGIEPPTR